MITKEQAQELIKEFKLPKNIVEHTNTVNRICLYLGNKAKLGNDELNLLDVSSMLHDLFKPIELDLDEEVFDTESRAFWKAQKEKYQGMDHTVAAYEYFKDSEPEIAFLIRSHKFKTILEQRKKSLPEKILKYADLRVKHDQIVSMKERLDDIKTRYAKPTSSQIPFSVFQDFENELVDAIGFRPDELLELNQK
ncbi:MAG: HD domain-containing protein [Nanoarchaeota archaeon]|nr:HD domain-containing protein [Nanoarchaeota archaeon]